MPHNTNTDTFFDLGTSIIHGEVNQLKYNSDGVPTGFAQYVGKTDRHFQHHSQNHIGLYQTATYDKSTATKITSTDGIETYTGGSISSTYRVFGEVYGWQGDGILPTRLPAGEYTDEAFTPPPEYLIAGTSNLFANYGEILMHWIGADYDIRRSNRDASQIRYRSAQAKINAGDEPNDRHKEPLNESHNANNPTATIAKSAFAHQQAITEANRIINKRTIERDGKRISLRADYFSLWLEIEERAMDIGKQPNHPLALQKYQQHIAWLLNHFGNEIATIAIIGRVAMIVGKDPDYPYYELITHDESHRQQVLCAIADAQAQARADAEAEADTETDADNMQDAGGQADYPYGIRYPDGSPIIFDNAKAKQ